MTEILWMILAGVVAGMIYLFAVMRKSVKRRLEQMESPPISTPPPKDIPMVPAYKIVDLEKDYERRLKENRGEKWQLLLAAIAIKYGKGKLSIEDIMMHDLPPGTQIVQWRDPRREEINIGVDLPSGEYIQDFVKRYGKRK